jgi:hypothetical protein
MHPFRTFTAAAVIAIGLHMTGGATPAAAETPSPDVVYHAPSWWIAAVIEGKQSTLLSGLPDNDRRMNVWMAGFGYGFGSGCGLNAETRQLEAVLKQQITARPAMEGPSSKGIEDGKRFAQINGCSNERASGVRRTVASLGGSIVVADSNNRPDNVTDNRPDRSGQNDRFDQQPVQAATEATVVNRSGARILVLRMSETWDRQWGADRLGEGVLDSGNAVRLALSGSRTCLYDLHVTYVNGQVEERRNVNLCQASQVVFDGAAAQFSRRSADAQLPNVVR